jgi:hypothetical protein
MHALPFTLFTITYKVAVYAPAERADIRLRVCNQRKIDVTSGSVYVKSLFSMYLGKRWKQVLKETHFVNCVQPSFTPARSCKALK